MAENQDEESMKCKVENLDKKVLECLALGGDTPETCGYQEKASTEAEDIERAKLDAEEPQGLTIEVKDRIGPFVYRFSYTVRPGEEPMFQDSENVRPFDRDLRPAADKSILHVNDNDDFYEIQVKLPGVEKRNIDLELYEDSFVIDTRDRARYHGQINFSVPVDPKTVSAECKNGVLYIRIGKAEKYGAGNATGTKITVM